MTELEKQIAEVEARYKQNAEGYRFGPDESCDGPTFVLLDPRGFPVKPDVIISGLMESTKDIPWLLEVLRVVLDTEHLAIDLNHRYRARVEQLKTAQSGGASSQT